MTLGTRIVEMLLTVPERMPTARRDIQPGTHLLHDDNPFCNLLCVPVTMFDAVTEHSMSVPRFGRTYLGVLWLTSILYGKYFKRWLVSVADGVYRHEVCFVTTCNF